jgi:hypothetical protein
MAGLDPAIHEREYDKVLFGAWKCVGWMAASRAAMTGRVK